MAAHPAVFFGRLCADTAHSTEATTAIRMHNIMFCFVVLIILYGGEKWSWFRDSAACGARNVACHTKPSRGSGPVTMLSVLLVVHV